MQKRNLVVVCIVSLFVLSFGQSIFGQAQQKDIGNLRFSIKAEKEPLGLVFRKLMKEYRLNIGFEQSNLDMGKWYFAFDTNLPTNAVFRSQSVDQSVQIETTVQSGFRAGPYPISLDIKDGSLNDVFDSIVSQISNYAWSVNEGVINIYPIRGRDDRLKRLLDLQVREFKLQHGSSVQDITPAILDLPEFMAFRRSNKLTFSPIREGVSSLIAAQYGRPVGKSIEFTNLTVRQLLNRITEIKSGGWILKIHGKTQSGGDLGDLDI